MSRAACGAGEGTPCPCPEGPSPCSVSLRGNPSQDGYSREPAMDAGSYENKQDPLPAASQPRLPASAVPCQPGGPL